MEHQFNTSLAKEYGIECAVLIQNIAFWIARNKANEKHYFEGRYWTYNSAKAFASQFDYLSPTQIQRHLKKLKELNILLCENFNEDKRDRSLWYAFSDNGLCILQNCGFHVAKLHNAKHEFEQCIYKEQIVNTDSKLQIVNTDILEQKKEKFEIFWNIYDKKVGKKEAQKLFLKLTDNEILEISKNIKAYIASKPDRQFRPDPERYIRKKKWRDEIIQHNPKPSSPTLIKSRVETNIQAAMDALELLRD